MSRGGRKKLIRFEAIKHMPNVFEFATEMKGQWDAQFFKNHNPIVLELACGKADYTTSLAQMYPGKNFIGIDKKGERIWAGATRGEALNLSNIAFLRIGIEQVAEYFGEGEVDEIWITFPGPFPKKPNKRLSAEKFLKEYQKIIKPEGILHFKTDDPDLFQFTLDSLDNYNAKVLQVISDVHHVEHGNAELDIITDFERRHIAKGRKIYYVRFQF